MYYYSSKCGCDNSHPPPIFSNLLCLTDQPEIPQNAMLFKNVSLPSSWVVSLDFVSSISLFLSSKKSVTFLMQHISGQLFRIIVKMQQLRRPLGFKKSKTQRQCCQPVFKKKLAKNPRKISKFRRTFSPRAIHCCCRTDKIEVRKKYILKCFLLLCHLS